MKVPASVKLAGHVIRFKYVPSLTDTDGTALFALAYPSDDRIEISTSRPAGEDQVIATVIHELAHCALGISGVAEVLDEKSEEAVCRAVEALAGAYKLDPRACRWVEVAFDFEEA